MMILEAACASNIGKVRGTNEDNYFFDGQWKEIGVIIVEGIMSFRKTVNAPICVAVFDGMGGERNGEEASFIAAKSVADGIHMSKIGAYDEADINELLIKSCMEANQKICESAEINRVRRMGSTAAILYAYEDKLWMCNIGDSRVYSLCEGELVQWSQDHTDAAYLCRQKISGRKPSLTQHLGILPQEMLIEPFVDSRVPRIGEKYLLCTDGLTDMVTREELEWILKKDIDLKECVQELMEMTLTRGGHDNITIIVCKIDDV